MQLHVVVTVIVACSIDVSMTSAQTIENHLFVLNHSSDLLVLNVHVRGKICLPFVHNYMYRTGIFSYI